MAKDGRDDSAGPPSDGTLDHRFFLVVTSLTRVAMAVVVAGAVVLCLLALQPIVKDLAGEDTEVQIDVAFKFSLVFNLALSAAVLELLRRLRRSTRQLQQAAAKPYTRGKRGKERKRKDAKR